MKDMTRRSFIASTAAVAAGVAVGAHAQDGIRRHRPVDIKTYFPDPVAIKGELSAHEADDVFRIGVLDDWWKDVRADFRLSHIREILRQSGRMARLRVTGRDGHSAMMTVVAREGNLILLVDSEAGHQPWPIWISLEDVRRVVTV